MSRDEILLCLDILAAATQERIDAEMRDLKEIERLRGVVMACQVSVETTRPVATATPQRERHPFVRGRNGSFRLSA